MGISYGDLVLQKWLSASLKVSRAGELRGRFGGDEFVAIVEYDSDDAIPRNVASALVKSLRRTHVSCKGLTVEIGGKRGHRHLSGSATSQRGAGRQGRYGALQGQERRPRRGALVRQR